MRGDEERVIVAFCGWLESEGWTSIRRRLSSSTRDSQTLYVEAKGRSSSPGLDVDTMYGQLLRRMQHPDSNARYGVVVPSSALAAALRVPEWVRERLKVDVYAVGPEGAVIGGWPGTKCSVEPIGHALSDLSDRFGFADEESRLRRGYGVGKVAMAWAQVPSLVDPCAGFTAIER